MTREQQITQASQGRFPEWGEQQHALELAFQAGCHWADNSLLEKIRQVDLSTTGRLHNIWKGMKQRCTNPKASGYEHYGAKGITVCDEWQTFVGFAVWALINGYSNELSIDRINTKGDYNPSNCRWADVETQANNTSRNHYIEGKTIAQYANENGLNYRTLHNRVTRGRMAIDKAIQSSPYNPKAVLCYTKEGELIAEYTSSKVACVCCGGALGGRGHINDVCRGKRKTALGFVWRYKENDSTGDKTSQVESSSEKPNNCTKGGEQ